MFTEKKLGRDFSLHFTLYLSTAFLKILPHSQKILKSKKLLELLVFG